MYWYVSLMWTSDAGIALPGVLLRVSCIYWQDASSDTSAIGSKKLLGVA